LILSPTIAHARDALIERAVEAGSVRELFRLATERLRRLVEFDAAAWVPTDPATGLPAGPPLLENLDHEACLRLWELGLLGEDSRCGEVAAALRAATHDCPERSARYRAVLRPRGFGDELRVVLVADGTVWAAVDLFRRDGAPPFDADDVELVAGLAEPLAEAVRRHARAAPPVAGGPQAPGFMLFGTGGEVTAVDDGAAALLRELPAEPGPLPLAVACTVVRARAVAQRRDRRPARARIRSRDGHWLALHATCLRDKWGAIAGTALVIEPAHAAETAALVATAHELTPREQQISQLIAAGSGTAEIADQLGLSAHTVRDYIKATFAKVGVSSRGELVAKLHAV
jgi:DNA-binding CsgD family transcriptional regulator